MIKKQVPILFIVFNRPSVTKVVWDAICASKPYKVYICQDAPRVNNKDDLINCDEVDSIFKNKQNFEIIRKKRFSNMGCKNGVPDAISWFFDNEEMGIIIEDDCVPTLSFFSFCNQMLLKFKDDTSVMHISGSNYLSSNQELNSFYVSTINDVWGWATWRRAWENFTFDMSDYPLFKKNSLDNKYFKNSQIASWMRFYLESAFRNESNVWSSYWVYAMIKHSGYTIVPTFNTVRNIGFIGEGTNNSKDFEIYQYINSVEKGFINFDDPNSSSVRYDLDKLRYKLISKTDRAASIFHRFRVLLNKLRRKIFHAKN